VNSKTVVRGGYGIVQYMEGAGANNRLTQNTPFVPVDSNVTFVGAPGTMTTGFADVIAGSAGQVGVGQVRVFQKDLKPQLTHQFNAFVERQVSDSMSLSVGYVGSRASRLAAFHNANQAGVGTGDPSTWAAQNRLPYAATLPSAGAIRYTGSDAKASYNGLQASLRHRRSKGLEFLASYTFSKSMQDNAGFYAAGWGATSNYLLHGKGGDGDQNARDPEADRGPSFFDVKHNLVLSANYELPIGKGRAKELSGVANAVLGGWNVSAIATVHSGFPVTVVDGWNIRSLQPSFTQERPNQVGDGDASGSFDWNTPGSKWLNPAAFAAAAPGTFGNAKVGSERGPGYYMLDLGLGKDFSLGGARALTIKLEAFNVLNHSNKGMPNPGWNDLANFGTITYAANDPRILELAAKLTF
jgi:hypothetical protein